MNRKPSVDGREVPSIIEEIVIYDKPNKPSVPQDIFPEPNIFPLGKGDIVLSRARDESLPGPSNQKNKHSRPSAARTTKERQVKNEPVEIVEEDLEYESEIDEFNFCDNVNNMKTEMALDNYSSTMDDDSSEPEESIENISKEISKSNANTQPIASSADLSAEKEPKRKAAKASVEDKGDIKEKQQVKETTVTTTITSKESKDSPFKKPRGRPRKYGLSTERQAQKSTVLSFIIKQPENLTPLRIGAEEEDESNDDMENNMNTKPDENSMGEVRQKRVRRRPKKFDDAEITIMDEETLEQYSDEDVSYTPPVKRKKYAELSIVPLYDNTSSTKTQAAENDNLDTLLNEVQEQILTLNEAEAELQNFVESDGQQPQKTGNSKKPAARLSRKAKKNNQDLLVGKNIKEELDEESEDVINQSHEEVFESDEDSRSEWVPEEYAEYKQLHKKLRTKVHKCKFCGAPFSSYYLLRKHRALAHDDVGTDRKESTFDPGEASEEVQEIEGETDEESSRGEWMPEDYAEYKVKHNLNKLKRSQWYKCKICCTVFSNYYKLSKHRVEHENKSDPYECKQCEAKFSDVDSFTAHIRVHQGKDPYKCKKCDKGFKTKEELIGHIPVHILRKAPIPLKRFRCDICGKEFSKLCDIERHTRVHTGEKPCECNICHKRFQQSHNLSKHLLTHLHVKPFQCEICNKKFGRIDVLNRHLLTHSMEKPFKCELCTKGFIRHVQLNNHLEKFHPEVDLTLAGLDSVTDEVTVTPLG